MSPIRRLPQHVINHIAAGEVIEKPTSIVKELIENSLDAQATRVEIDVVHGGTQKIQVSDNGTGIERKSLPLLFERYATSKTRELEDMHNVKSLGFRGEALFSIMNASDVTVITRAFQEPLGNWIRTYRGQMEQIQPTGTRVGTTVIIDRIFDRFPVRQQSLQSKKEFQEIKQLVTGFALSHPSVAFVLKQQGKIELSFFDHETIVDRIARIWSNPIEKLISFSAIEPEIQLKGWLSSPEHFASNSKNQLISINNRIVDQQNIHHTLEQCLKTLNHPGKYPQYFLALTIDPHLIDVNVHPQKTTLQLMKESEILKMIKQSIEESIQSIDLSHVSYTGVSFFPEPTTVRDQTPLAVAGEITQIDDTYLLVPTNQGFLMIDQHAADERLWYNRLLEDEDLVSMVSESLSWEAQEELEDDVYQHSFDEMIDARLATIACHSAIRAGQLLSQKEMQNLTKATLEGGVQTITCPHGRPTYIHVTLDQLEKLFRRR